MRTDHVLKSTVGVFMLTLCKAHRTIECWVRFISLLQSFYCKVFSRNSGYIAVYLYAVFMFRVSRGGKFETREGWCCHL